jgi:glutathione peroxidase
MCASSKLLACFSLPVLLGLNLPADPAATNAPPAATPAPAVAGPSLFNFTVNALDGKPVDLGQYRGHVVLVVNTASHCGFVSQYAGLEKLYQDYKDRGLVVLAFPSNDFGGQEPGSTKEIEEMCATKFNVTFPILEKTRTKGPGQSPVYEFLAAGHGAPAWNFHKYLVDKSGKVIAEFPSQDAPQNKDITDAIEAALKS